MPGWPGSGHATQWLLLQVRGETRVCWLCPCVESQPPLQCAKQQSSAVPSHVCRVIYRHPPGGQVDIQLAVFGEKLLQSAVTAQHAAVSSPCLVANTLCHRRPSLPPLLLLLLPPPLCQARLMMVRGAASTRLHCMAPCVVM